MNFASRRMQEGATSVVFRYGAAVLLVIAAALITTPIAREIDTTPLFYAAVFISSWYGGIGPGFLAVVASTVLLNYYFSPPTYRFTPGIHDLPQLVVFAVLAILVNVLSTARKCAERSLRQARDELEAKVVERTADLQKTNEQLRLEIAERARAEAVVGERAALLDLTHDTVFVRDLNNIILYWNRGAQELYGWHSEEALGRSTHDLMQTVFPYALEEIERELYATDRWAGELIHSKRDGSRVTVASRWSLQRDEQGAPFRILETNNDITALREGERRYRNIFEGAGVSIWEEDFSQVKAAIDELKASGVRDFRQYITAHPEFVRQTIPMVKVLEVNEATLKLLGAGTKDELLGSLERIFLPETVDIFAGELVAIAEGRNSIEAETVLQTLQGEKLWVLFTITFPPERPELDRVLVSIMDISERKRAEAAVRASEQVARGQVDALMQSLDVLATAPAPETFIREMLVTIGRQLRALRVALWLRTKSDDALRLRLAVEGEQPVPEDPEHPFVKDPHAWKTMAIGQEMLFTGGPVVCEEMEQDTRLSEELRAYLTNKGARKFLTVPVLVTGEVRGFIGIQHPARDPYRSEEIELAQALAHQVMLAIQLTQLAEQGRHAAILEERTRMARDIHDTLAQGFTGVVVQMEAAEDALSDEASDEALEHIRRARQLARDSLNEARRSVRALRPQALERAGFCAALKQTIVKPTIGTPLRSEFQVEGEVRELPSGVEENLLHIGQEALTNTLKHAQASRFEARLCFDPAGVRLELTDNGQGFIDEGANDGFGLIGMRERVEQIGGTLTVSSAQGEGTKIVAVAPYQPEETG